MKGSERVENNSTERSEKLKSFETRELVEELRKREGVAFEVAEPYEKKKVDIEGPAIMLIVID